MKDQSGETQIVNRKENDRLLQVENVERSLDSHSNISVTIAYRPLNQYSLEIRIFRLLSDNADSQIRGELFHGAAHSSTMPPFTAISYCWGDPHDLVPITVDGTTTLVTRNLELGLRELRS